MLALTVAIPVECTLLQQVYRETCRKMLGKMQGIKCPDTGRDLHGTRNPQGLNGPNPYDTI